MSRRRKVLAVGGGVIAGVLVLVLFAVFVLTRTDWGRERIRAFGIDQLASQVAGEVTIGELSGNLLRGATIAGIEIADSAGAPFLRADTVLMQYSLRSFLSKHLVFTDVVLVNPTIVLDQPPGGEWNFVRLFPQDTTAKPDTLPGFGSWVRFEDVTIRNGTVVLRTAWEPADSLSGAARERAVAEALSSDNRLWIVPVEGGYQMLSFYRDLDASLPYIRIADPDSAARVIEIESLDALAFPFRPPPADVRGLSGRIVISEDSVRFGDLQLALPGTSAAGSGVYVFGEGDVRATIRAKPLSFEDLRWVMPALPEGGGEIAANVQRSGGTMRVEAGRIDVSIAGATVVGHATVHTGDSLRIGDTELVFANVDPALIERFAPGRTVPVQGRARGRIALDGVPSALRVDGWAEFRQQDGGTSRVVADGEIGTGEAVDGVRAEALRLRLDPLRVDLLRAFAPSVALTGYLTGDATVTGSTASQFRLDADIVHVDPRAGRSRVLANGALVVRDAIAARDLRLRLDPVQVGVLRAFAPDLPITGTIDGTATVNGGSAGRIAAVLDLVLNAETGRSHVIGEASVTPRAGPRFDVDLRAPELSLATLGAFAPAAGLQGTAQGVIGASGTSSAMTFAADLALLNGGVLAANGDLSFGGPELGYDIQAVLDDVDASAASDRAPETGVTGTLTVSGTGTDPATMVARLQASLVDVQWDSARADTTRIDATIDAGLVRFDRAHLSLASASADLEGSFGIIEGRSGTLRYRIAVDSLSDFAQWIPGDTVAAPPRPVLQARRTAAARADSLRRFRETEVERAATGYPLPPTLDVDSVRAIRGDSVAGSIRAEGTVAGNIRRFDADGIAHAGGLVAAGVAVDTARAEYSVNGFGTEDADAELELTTGALRTGGFAFDSAAVSAAYAGVMDRGRGTADIALYQDPDRDYRLHSAVLLELDRRELTFTELLLRFDTVQWTAPHPSRIEWAGTGVTIDSLELHSSAGGRIFAHGDVPSEGETDLRIEIDGLPIGQVIALLQDTMEAGGVFDLDATIRGTLEAPRFDGTSTLVGGSYGGRPLPDMQTAFEYADTRLDANIELTQDARTLLVADAELPVNLALSGVEGERTLDGPLRIEARMDSLPLQALPSFTESVRDVRGRLRGQLTVTGTYDDPMPTGGFDLDLASLHLVPAGVTFQQIAGGLRIEPEAMTLDSLVAMSAGGTVRADGTISLETLSQPSFDLAVVSNGARVLNNQYGRVRADAELAITGPLDSLAITGEAEIVDGVLYAPETGRRRATELDDPRLAQILDTAAVAEGVLPERNRVLENLRLEVGLSVARNTWVRNSEANVEIYTPDDAEPLMVRMVPDTGLVLEGVINADRGEYVYSGRVFELTTGSVAFLGGEELDPLLQLSARYEVPRRDREALAIQIHVAGTLTEPRVTLESTAQPPLSQSDLLAYLAFGRSSSSLLDLNSSGASGGAGIGGLAQQQLAGLAIGALVDEAVSNVEREGARAGLDVFRISPAELPEELAFSGYLENFLRSTEVVAGKYVGRRLFVAAKGRTTTETWPGFRVEYRADRGFSFETVWEPRFMPIEPSLATDQRASTARTFGAFMFWRRRF